MASARTTDRFLPVFIVWDIGPGAGDEWTEMMNEAVSNLVDELAGMDSKVPVEFCFIGYGEKPHVKKKMSALTGRELVNFEAEAQSNLEPALDKVAAFARDLAVMSQGVLAPLVILLGSRASDVSSEGRPTSIIAGDEPFKDFRDALGPKAVRLAAGYGNGPDYNVLNAFIDDETRPVISLGSRDDLSEFMGWAMKLIRDKASSDDTNSVVPSGFEESFGRDRLRYRIPEPQSETETDMRSERERLLPGADERRGSSYLPVFLLVDTSYSMKDDIDKVTNAVSELLEVVQAIDGDVRVCIIRFGCGLKQRTEVVKPLSGVGHGEKHSFNLGCSTPLGAGLISLREELLEMPPGALEPVIILISDGTPTDYELCDDSIESIRQWEPMHEIIDKEPSKSAMRASMAIGQEIDENFLLAFNSDGVPVVQSSPEAIGKFFRKMGEAIEDKMALEDANGMKTIDFSTDFSTKELVFKRMHLLGMDTAKTRAICRYHSRNQMNPR